MYEVMPISREEYKKGKVPSERLAIRAEKYVSKVLSERYKMDFKKKRVKIGDGRLREFDLVSEDNRIFVQIKSRETFHSLINTQLSNRFAKYMLDCITLHKSPGTMKIFIITDRKMYEWFLIESSGLVEPDITVEHIEVV